jgi:hypothetical protein
MDVHVGETRNVSYIKFSFGNYKGSGGLVVEMGG